ncbi:MAG: prepilin-type N-terminal cleavage/methylation domain-containing protein [Planctomycetaceae bacterium]
MRRLIPHPAENLTRRTGVTLTEVLMSLMIMSIGVSAVAVLFPISTLRSIQANRLTHGAILKYNVEGILQAEPNLIFDPDGDGNFQEHFVPITQRNYVVDPFGFYTLNADGNPFYATYGNDGTNPGFLTRWGGGLGTLDGYIPEASPLPLIPFTPPPTPAHLSALRLMGLVKTNQGDGWSLDIDTMPSPLPTSVVVTGAGVTGVTLPLDLDLSDTATSELLMLSFPSGTPGIEYLIPDPELYRIVVYSLDGLRSQTFPLTHIDTTTNTAYWSEDITGDGTADHDYNMNGTSDIRPLPVEFGGAIGRVIIQSRKVNDFNWMLTVRRRSDGFVRNVDVVVRYSDGADALNERLFEAMFVSGSTAIGIRYPYRTNASDTTTPKFRKGGFVFDAQNARWYRIQDYREVPVGNIGWAYPYYDAVVFTEDVITDAGGEDQYTINSGGTSILLNGIIDTAGGVSEDLRPPGNNDGNLTPGYAMFPPSVIDVYPMGSMQMP